MTLRASMTRLREGAERCLTGAPPTPAEARALATLALAVVAEMEALTASLGHPYRTAPDPDARPADVATLVALERALDDCQARLGLALAELAALRGAPRAP
jgi:hypothetical protein